MGFAIYRLWAKSCTQDFFTLCFIKSGALRGTRVSPLHPKIADEGSV